VSGCPPVSGGSYGYSRGSAYGPRAPSPVDYLYPPGDAAEGSVASRGRGPDGRLLREVSAAAQRLEAGDRAYREGDIRLASGIYVRLAGSHPPNPITLQARERLTKLAQEAREKLAQVDAALIPKATPLDGSYEVALVSAGGR